MDSKAGLNEWLILGFLGIVSLCLIILTILWFSAMRDLRRLVREIQRLLPQWEDTLRAAQGTFDRFQEVLYRTHTVATHWETVSRYVRDTFSGWLEPIQGLVKRTKAWVKGHGTNGRREGPHRHGRKVGNRRRIVR